MERCLPHAATGDRAPSRSAPPLTLSRDPLPLNGRRSAVTRSPPPQGLSLRPGGLPIPPFFEAPCPSCERPAARAAAGVGGTRRADHGVPARHDQRGHGPNRRPDDAVGPRTHPGPPRPISRRPGQRGIRCPALRPGLDHHPRRSRCSRCPGAGLSAVRAGASAATCGSRRPCLPRLRRHPRHDPAHDASDPSCGATASL